MNKSVRESISNLDPDTRTAVSTERSKFLLINSIVLSSEKERWKDTNRKMRENLSCLNHKINKDLANIDEDNEKLTSMNLAKSSILSELKNQMPILPSIKITNKM